MPNEEAKDLTKKQRFWLTHLEACEKSEQSVTSYAAAHGLNRRVLYSWRSRLQRMGLVRRSVTSSSPRSQQPRSSGTANRSGSQKGALGFRAVRLVDLDESSSGLRIRFPNGIILETRDAPGAVPSHELLSVLAALR